MKIVLIGHEYFCQKLSKKLSDFDQKNKYEYVSGKRRFITILKKLYKIITADSIYMIGGTLEDSLTINIGRVLNKKIVMHWVGTDVLLAKEQFTNKKYNVKYISECIHLCEVDWIQNELKEIGISAHVCDLIILDEEILENNLENIDQFSILTYIAKGREKFYGIDLIYEAAEKYPHINFVIMGTDGEGYKLVSNIKFLGWVQKVKDEYKKCYLFLRLVKHDGVSFSVIEALSLGRYVAYTYFLPFTGLYCIKNKNDLFNCISEMENKFNSCKSLNKKGKSEVVEKYKLDRVLKKIVKKLNGIN